MNLRTPFTVVVPAFNEEDSIGPQIVEIQRVLAKNQAAFEILVVDDGSSDSTSEKALRAGARVLRHQHNRGYGAAIKAGIMAARNDTIVIIDADGTYPADEIPHLVSLLETADMVVGARVGDTVHVPLPRRPAKWLLRWLAVYITEQEIPDLNSGLRAFRRDCVEQYFPIVSNRFSFTTTITMALLADDYAVLYHPINYYQRTGKSKIQPRHFMDFVVLILRMSMMFQPLKVFVPLAFACAGLGVIKAIYDTATLFLREATFSWSLLYQPTLSTSSVLLLLVGLQLLLIGMMADGVVRRIAQHSRPRVTSQAVSNSRGSFTLELEAAELDDDSASVMRAREKAT